MQRKGSIGNAPSAEEIRSELELILASTAFCHSPTLAAFLRFVVEAALAGQGERLKGYTIAVEALGRGTDFDPETDAIVRVDAGRIRRALSRHYETEGAHDAVAIDLPYGRYAPTFRRRTRNLPDDTELKASAPIKSDLPPIHAVEILCHLRDRMMLDRAAAEAEINSIQKILDHSRELLASLDRARSNISHRPIAKSLRCTAVSMFHK